MPKGIYKRNINGENNPKWRGGRIVRPDGYILIYSPTHPNPSSMKRYVFEHRLVMEKHLGRYLSPDEHIHHLNEIKNDNRIENLQIVSVQEHSRLHCSKIIDGNKKCIKCNEWKNLIENFNKSGGHFHSYCRDCRKIYYHIRSIKLKVLHHTQ